MRLKIIWRLWRELNIFEHCVQKSCFIIYFKEKSQPDQLSLKTKPQTPSTKGDNRHLDRWFQHLGQTP